MTLATSLLVSSSRGGGSTSTRRSMRSSLAKLNGNTIRMLSTNLSWATLDPNSLGEVATPHYVQNIVGGSWQPESSIQSKISVPHPMNKDSFPICHVADTSVDELAPFRESLKKVTKSGLHNPIKNVERYLMYGEISRKVRYYYEWISIRSISACMFHKCIQVKYSTCEYECECECECECEYMILI